MAPTMFFIVEALEVIHNKNLPLKPWHVLFRTEVHFLPTAAWNDQSSRFCHLWKSASQYPTMLQCIGQNYDIVVTVTTKHNNLNS